MNAIGPGIQHDRLHTNRRDVRRMEARQRFALLMLGVPALVVVFALLGYMLYKGAAERKISTVV